jgi:pilus assembly protein CpaC
VEPTVSNLNASNGFAIGGVIVQGRDEQRVRTSIMMEPGQTFAIGGLIQTSTSAATNKTPFLGDLPFIGPAFSTITHQDSETELVILVTPYLVDPMDCRQAPCKLPGMETRSPDDFELFLELILEAPRGQREVFPDKKYKAAYLNDPSAARFPCGGSACGAGGCGTGGCATGGCATGSCGTPGGCAAGAQPATTVAPAAPAYPAATSVVPAASQPSAAATPADAPDIVPAALTLPARPAGRP